MKDSGFRVQEAGRGQWPVVSGRRFRVWSCEFRELTAPRALATDHWPLATVSRRGFSLIEVLLATAVLLGCVVVMAQIARLGRLNAVDAENFTRAELVCQTRLNEILAGAVPMRAVRKEYLAEMPGWVLSVEVEPARIPTLAVLRVRVAQDVPEGQIGKHFTLVRWVRDPGNLASTAPEATEDAFPESSLPEDLPLPSAEELP